jgi:hypothetical protein
MTVPLQQQLLLLAAKLIPHTSEFALDFPVCVFAGRGKQVARKSNRSLPLDTLSPENV